MKYIEFVARVAMLASGKPESDYPNLMESMLQDLITTGYDDIGKLMDEQPGGVMELTLQLARNMPPESLKHDMIEKALATDGTSLVDMLPSLRRTLDE